jgi:hypothetical protein
VPPEDGFRAAWGLQVAKAEQPLRSGAIFDKARNIYLPQVTASAPKKESKAVRRGR